MATDQRSDGSPITWSDFKTLTGSSITKDATIAQTILQLEPMLYAQCRSHCRCALNECGQRGIRRKDAIHLVVGILFSDDTNKVREASLDLKYEHPSSHGVEALHRHADQLEELIDFQSFPPNQPARDSRRRLDRYMFALDTIPTDTPPPIRV